MIHCRTLGPIDVTVDGAAPPPALLWRKNLALLVYLACSPKHSRTREHLTGLLWAEKPDSAARHSLREAIRVLRRAVGEEGLTTQHEQVRLAQGAVRLDLEEFEAMESAADWGGVAALVDGDFLEGFSVPDASGFEDWLAAERLAWRSRSVTALVNCAESLLVQGNVREAASTTARALALDGGSNAAVRAAMRALALVGDRTGALERYEHFVRHLAEAGAAPEAETTTLAERVRAERIWRLSDEVPTSDERGAELRRPPLVGRERELARIVEAFVACGRERRAAAAIIEGDAGLGKSRLAEEVLARSRLSGAATAVVRAVEADLDHPGSGALGLARGGWPHLRRRFRSGATSSASPRGSPPPSGEHWARCYDRSPRSNPSRFWWTTPSGWIVTRCSPSLPPCETPPPCRSSCSSPRSPTLPGRNSTTCAPASGGTCREPPPCSIPWTAQR